MVEEGRENELSVDERFLKEAQKKHYTRLSVSEVVGFFDTVANIDHMGRRAQKLVDAQNQSETLTRSSAMLSTPLIVILIGQRYREQRLKSMGIRILFANTLT